ncbi:MAG: chemotaxis protein CheA [Sulfurimonas sp. RIFCSPHIGHO2_12_FULL_36_9]|jgi:two-component system chemotaxis sensor kinase CheA|uniref:Hpt domain-containing protein n=1 Tax=unclassified Sulfurimonas TaxID=2623549 RepID=UPI0008B10E54|nr:MULTISPECIES: Hpt domain-containing protein [unclassified Sulfurimonas]OHD97210.1 MAG: chemotaxis protein CheA [Sulfurimonas sp. RIFCSPHIGHO2_12_FULL_36_9]OHE00103.1 MAG: chemotaxis protein CheA [Sulfurimonas sp. RIFCSPLOWO2_02_FULL_36_28]OHE03045.1 MAG: chemotaxis protein CheA [Sulfurimonas sp. RIFCSPLOWO2_12_36_12]OHE05503.1 MAG: chemotaxis protein CheA [Sulfurimonas sp. RIFCSPLOWO2_12_FULL_36_74]
MGIRSDLDSNFDYEIVDEFLDHYSMMVDYMEVMILDLKKPNKYEQSINELFRVFHNIKSASSFLKITQMSKLSAFVEDALEQIRTNHSSVNEETITWLLEISDMFGAWKDDLKLDNELTHIKYSLLKLPDLENN